MCYPDTIFTVGVLESYDGAGMNGRKKLVDLFSAVHTCTIVETSIR